MRNLVLNTIRTFPGSPPPANLINQKPSLDSAPSNPSPSQAPPFEQPADSIPFTLAASQAPPDEQPPPLILIKPQPQRQQQRQPQPQPQPQLNIQEIFARCKDLKWTSFFSNEADCKPSATAPSPRLQYLCPICFPSSLPPTSLK